MAFAYHLPDLAEGMIEAEVVAWKVKLGDKIAMDQPVVEILTDKATMEIPSPRAGTLSKINYGEGEVCPVGKVLFEIEEVGTAVVAPVADAPPTRPTSPTQPSPPAAAQVRSELPGTGNGRVPVIDATADRARVLATPATRRLARQLGVELGEVAATGKRGRVTTADVEAHARAETQAAEVTTVMPAVREVTSRVPIAPVTVPTTGREERIPMRGVRRMIADNMTRSVATAAHFTYVEEVDVSALVALRDQAKDKASERGVKLTYLPFIIKAVVSALRQWPQLNAALDEAAQEIVRKHYYHIGIAAQGPQGLMVTVIRDADQRSIFGIAREIDRLADVVQAGTASRDDLTGSTFTISSLGKLGGLHATPILNFPEVGILGIHKIEQRAVVIGGSIVPRWRMNLSISLDHRLVDGWDGAMFLQQVKSMLEDPTLMFMEMI